MTTDPPSDPFDLGPTLELDVTPASVTRREVAEMVEQLAALTRSGLPLPSGLRAAGAELTSGSARATFFQLASDIEAGQRLDDALTARSQGFPPHVRGLVVAGARSGRLADVLSEYVRAAAVGEELRGKFWATLAYPVLTLGLVVTLVGFVCHLSVRAVDELLGNLPDLSYMGGGRKSQDQSELIILLARFIDQQGWWILLVSVGLACLIWGSVVYGLDAVNRRRLVVGVPVLGPVLRFAALTELCHLLAMLIEAEIPLPAAMKLAGGGVRDAELAAACARMGEVVENGEPLSVAVQEWPGIPAGLGQLFRWSEIHRGLPEALHLAGDMFEARTRSQASFARSVMGMVLLLLILWWIGFAVAALYLPLGQTMRMLSG